MNNYTLIKEEISEDYGEIKIYNHSSGMKIVTVKNDDNNRVFSIGFRTPPFNNRGGFHVLEHCCFCGSKKFPIKDTFNYLSKSTIHTYLNAMTFHDKTVFPVASTDENHFKFMIDVYMDGVLNPNIYENKFIFMQEGIHLKFDNLDKPTSVKPNEFGGIVYNEMQGAYSDKLYKLTRALHRLIFNNHYIFDAAGSPEQLKKLTYEEVLYCHKNYYNCSNGIIYLYGDINISDYLTYLDNEYLCNNKNIAIPKLSNFNPVYSDVETEIFSHALASQNEFLLGILFDCENILENRILIEILSNYLFDSKNSVLKKSLRTRGDSLCNITTTLDFHMEKILCKIHIENTKFNEFELKNIMLNSLETTKTRINTKELIKIINLFEFKYMENNNPNRPIGLQLFMELIAGYKGNNDDIETNIFFIKNIFVNIRKKILIENQVINLINNISTIEIVSLYTAFQGNKNNYQIPECRINNKSEYDSFIVDLKNPDNDHILEEITKITINKQKVDVQFFPIFEFKKNIYFSRIKNNSICYINFYFNIDKIHRKYYDFIRIFNKIVNTSMEDLYYENSNISKTNIMHTVFSTIFITFRNINTNSISKNVSITAKTTMNNYTNIINFIHSFFSSLNFNIPDNICNEIKSKDHLDLTQKSEYFGKLKVSNNESLERVYGHTSIEFIRKITNHQIYSNDEIAQIVNTMAHKLFTPENAKIFCFFDKNHEENHLEQLELLSVPMNNNSFDVPDSNPKFDYFKYTDLNTIYIDTNFNSNNLSMEFGNISDFRKGSMHVFVHLLNTEYLYKEVRLELGAYDCVCEFNYFGNLIFSSKFDVELEKTYNIYNKIFHFMDSYKLSDKTLDSLITGTISKFDKPLTPEAQCLKNVENHFMGITENDLTMLRNEILNTTKEEISELVSNLKKSYKSSKSCTIGGLM